MTARPSAFASLCAPGALSLLVAACAGPPPPLRPSGVDSRVDTVYYDVLGTTPREWARTIHAMATAAGLAYPAVGATRAGPAWSFGSYRSTTTGCQAVSPQVRLNVRFLMPRLRDDSLVVGGDRAEWRRFVTALWTHEQGHALRAARAAEELRVQMHRSRGATCRGFVADVRASADSLVERLRAEQTAYDEISRHGQRQGVGFVIDRMRPSPIDSSYHDSLP